MIPFASQRGNGQDLATHLLNAHDNERVELFEVRRAVARDLHGAFAEWEAIAKGLTRARQYLCSLSVNPDERQGRLTRAQYLDYIDRVEAALGLTGQPRAIIFHEKCGDDGAPREHCHVVWSRTDVKNKRAIPLSFFKEKLMSVTREFARDHGLRLPPGYDQQADQQRRNMQLSPYDCVKQKETGVSHAERMAVVTDAWRRSDSAKAFVAALESLGYVLARGRNGTRIVLVDFYGHTTALTRLIDDASVRAKHVRDFLGSEFAPERLPTVEEAQELAEQRRVAVEAFEAVRMADEESDQPDRRQATRREEIEAKAALFRRRQHEARVQLSAEHKHERDRLKSSYLAAQQRIRAERTRRRPRGLAAFLARVSGIALITRKVQRHRDRKRYAAYLVWRDELRRRQWEDREALAKHHALQAADMERQLRALDQIEQREREATQQARRRQQRKCINARHDHMPAYVREAKSSQQSGSSAGAPTASEDAVTRQMAEAARLLKEGRRPVSLRGAFAEAAGTNDDEGDSGDTAAAAPSGKPRKRARRRPSLCWEFQQAASDEQGDGDGAGDSSEAPKPVAEPPKRRRRRRERKSRVGPTADRYNTKRSDANEQDAAKGRDRHRQRRKTSDSKPGT